MNKVIVTGVENDALEYSNNIEFKRGCRDATIEVGFINDMKDVEHDIKRVAFYLAEDWYGLEEVYSGYFEPTKSVPVILASNKLLINIPPDVTRKTGDYKLRITCKNIRTLIYFKIVD